MVGGVRRWILAGLAALCVIAAIPGADPSAAPRVDVRARTRIELSSVERIGDNQLAVRGRLVDSGTSTGLEGQTIEVNVAGRRMVVRTERDGEFSTVLTAPAGATADIAMTYAGADQADASELRQAGVELRKQSVAIVLTTTPDGSGVNVTISTTAGGAPANVEVELAAGPSDRDPTPIGRVPSNSTQHVARAQLGGAGRGRVVVTYPGNDDLATARAEVAVESRARSQLEARLGTATVPFEDDVVVAGRVIGDDGSPLPRAPVSLLTGDRRLTQGVSNERGEFRLALEAQLLGTGRFPLQVAVDPSSPWIEPSRSAPLVVTIAAAEPVPVAFTIAAFAVTAAVIGGFFWMRARRRPPRRIVATPEDQDAPAPPVTGGLSLGKAPLVDALRRAADHGLAGVVREAVRQRPLAGAQLRLRCGDTEQWLTTDAAGRFAVDDLAPGKWQVKVAAGGHVAERFEVGVPHHGELRSMRVDLVPVREQIFALYRRAAEPLLPEPRLWGVWSPRQIVDHVRRARPRPELAVLTAFVEDAYFSARVFEETVLDEARAKVERAVAEHQAATAATT